jgi:predicted Zn-dependent protease
VKIHLSRVKIPSWSLPRQHLGTAVAFPTYRAFRPTIAPYRAFTGDALMAALLSRSDLRQTVPLLLVFVVALAGPGCAPPGQERGSGPGHRRQILSLTPEQEYDLGEKAYRQILAKARQNDALLSSSSQKVEQVRRVGERIVEAVKNRPLQREINLNLRGYRFDWQFNVIRSRQVNAFCLPGGRVAVFTGLLQIVDNNDQLATVLSHEIAHALAHHANERITTEESGRVSWISRQAYDRQQESEADHIGLFLMTFAGYDPDQALVFWRHMQRLSQGGELPEILSNHPSDRRRIEQLRVWIPQAKAGKEAYDHHRIAPDR